MMRSLLMLSVVFALAACQRNEFSVRQCTAEQRQALQDAATEWCSVTGGRACPVLVDDGGPNSVTCAAAADLPAGTDGRAELGHGLEGSNLTIPIDYGTDVAHDIALHEFGHWVAQDPGHLRPSAHGIMAPVRDTAVHSLTKLDLQWYCFSQGCRVQNGQIVW